MKATIEAYDLIQVRRALRKAGTDALLNQGIMQETTVSKNKIISADR
ncbi:MAG: hypothetical protein ACK5LK_02435 [Chthoniobacterales bacterium]